jgi:cobalt-zinc-cadmium efflux system outer membrane protein
MPLTALFALVVAATTPPTATTATTATPATTATTAAITTAPPTATTASTASLTAVDPALAPPPGCRGSLTAAVAVRCALAASPAVLVAERGVAAAEGRGLAARTLLPSNPTVEVTAAARHGLWTGDRDINVYGRLSQELEVAGQRGRRKRLAAADLEAQQRRVDAVRREVAADVLIAHVEALAAKEQRAMVQRLSAAAQALVDLTREGEKAGLASGLSADVAATTLVRLRRQQIEADRRLATAHALLAGLIGQDPTRPDVDAAGQLAPLPVPEDTPALVARALAGRAELDVARAEREVHQRRADLYRRLRAPNPSLVLYAQRDGFNERVLGGGVAIPIVLPGALGRNYRGEIAESTALARQADAELERLRRQIAAEVVAAAETFKARRDEVAAFDPQRILRAESHVVALGEEMAAGRLPIREAVVLQQTFLELLAAHLEARRALSLAAVELARVAGLLPLEPPR